MILKIDYFFSIFIDCKLFCHVRLSGKLLLSYTVQPRKYSTRPRVAFQIVFIIFSTSRVRFYNICWTSDVRFECTTVSYRYNSIRVTVVRRNRPIYLPGGTRRMVWMKKKKHRVYRVYSYDMFRRCFRAYGLLNPRTIARFGPVFPIFRLVNGHTLFAPFYFSFVVFLLSSARINGRFILLLLLSS